MAVVHDLEFKNIHIRCLAVIVFQMCGCTKFHRNRMICHRDIAIKQYTIWRLCAILNFRNLEFVSHDLCRHAIVLLCAKFH